MDLCKLPKTTFCIGCLLFILSLQLALPTKIRAEKSQSSNTSAGLALRVSWTGNGRWVQNVLMEFINLGDSEIIIEAPYPLNTQIWYGDNDNFIKFVSPPGSYNLPELISIKAKSSHYCPFGLSLPFEKGVHSYFLIYHSDGSTKWRGVNWFGAVQSNMDRVLFPGDGK